MEAVKNIKMRRCVSCRTVRQKSELLRVVKTPAGEFALDFAGKAQGRGAYVCKNEKCAAENLKRRKMDKTLKAKVPAEIYDAICAAVAANSDSSTF